MSTDQGGIIMRLRGPFAEMERELAEVLAKQRDSASSMTLRDYFAGQALAGGMVSDTMKEYQLVAAFGVNRTSITREKIIVANAYLLADAMLKARDAK